MEQFAIGQEIDKVRNLSLPRMVIFMTEPVIQLPPNDAYLIFTAAVLHAYNLGVEEDALKDAAKPRLEKCIEWLRVRHHGFA